jgi:predicted PurR-regulated permease PerM
MSRTKKLSFNTVQHIFFFMLIIGFALAFWQLIAPFAYPIFWAAVLAIAFYPLYNYINSHIKHPNLSSFITVILIILFVFLPLILLSYVLIDQSISIYNKVSGQDFIRQAQVFLNSLKDTPLAPYIVSIESQIIENSSTAMQTITSTIFNSLRNITTASIRFIFQFCIMLYTLYYFFKDGPRFLHRLLHLSPLGDKYELLLYERFTSTTRATLKSTVIIGGIQGILGGILFAIAGIKGVILWGFIMVIIGIIPAVGPLIILIPVGIFLLINGAIWKGLMLIIGGILISAIDNLLRGPLVGKDIQMHPLIVLFSTLGGLALFGVPGFIIGPIIAALFISILTIYDYYYKKELEKN